MDDALISCQISSSSILVLIRFKHNLKAQINKFKMAIHKREREKKKTKKRKKKNSKSFIY